MLNFLILLILMFSLVTALFNGKIDFLCNQLLDSPQKAVELTVTVGCSICLWSGVMEVARQSGLLRFLSKFFSPILRHQKRLSGCSSGLPEPCRQSAGTGSSGRSGGNLCGVTVSACLSRPVRCVRQQHPAHSAQYRLPAINSNHCRDAALTGWLRCSHGDFACCMDGIRSFGHHRYSCCKRNGSYC